MSSNPLVADRTDSTTPLAGTFLFEDGEALVQAIESKDWVSGSLAVVSGVFDAAAAISDPLGTLFAMGIGWLLDHMEPFPTWLEQLTGDADQVRAHATTWQNVQEQMNQCAQSMTGYVKSDLADMSGQAISAYTGAADDVAKAINAAGSWAGAMGTALNITATIVQFVHDLVRDALAEIVGSILSYAAELIASAGTALPLVLQQIATRVASLVGRIGRNIEDLISSARNLVSKLGDLKALFKSLKDKLDDLFRGGKKGDSPNTITPKDEIPKTSDTQPSLTELFREREMYRQQRDTALAELDAHMPPGFSRSDFTARKIKHTIADLREMGYDPEEIQNLQKASRAATQARSNFTETSAHIGEAGGEKYLDNHPDYHLPSEFRTNGKTQPGGWSDGAAVRTDQSEFALAEYKGGKARHSSSPVSTQFEGPAKQGTAAYARDHLLKDPRFAQYFHDNPHLWEGVRNGTTQLNFKTIYTRTPDDPPVVEDLRFDILTGTGGTEVLDALQGLIDKLD